MLRSGFGIPARKRQSFLFIKNYVYKPLLSLKIKAEVHIMFSMKKEKIARKSPRKNISFYISLALCIAAVAGAAWNTYGSIDEYVETGEESSQSSCS